MQAQEAVLRAPLFVNQREYYARQFRVQAVEQAVRGEMDDLIAAEIRTERRRAVGLEIERFEAHPLRGERRDLISFAAAKYQPLEPLLRVCRADFKSRPGDLLLGAPSFGLFVIRRS